MTSIIVLVVILAMAALVYFKVSMVQAMATIVVALLSSFAAFGYYEMVGGLLAGFVSGLAPWSQVISFVLLFVLTFAVLQTGVVSLLKGPVDLGTLPERIGRPIFGIVLGWIVAGVILTTIWLSPLGSQWPYSRYDSSRPNPDEPQSALLNADGMVTGWFSMVSRGSFSAIRKPASFGIVRAGFLDQLSLNQLKDSVSRSTSEQTLTAEKKSGVWNLPDLQDTDGEAITPPSGHRIVAVRLGIRKKSLKDSSPFTMGQVSVVCKSGGRGENPLAGTGVAVYPIGYLDGERLQKKSLTEKISISSQDVKKVQQWIDFVFFVPRNADPVLGRFKLNSAVALSKVVEMDEAPEASDFSSTQKRESESASEEG